MEASMARRRSRIVFALATGLFASSRASAEPAPGAPGRSSTWSPGQKSFIGTTTSSASRVYFTGHRGSVSEVFYPTLDAVQSVALEFLVSDAAGSYLDRESAEEYLVTRPDPRSMLWRVDTGNTEHGWRLSKRVFADPAQNALVLRVTFWGLEGRKTSDYHLYLRHDPALDGSGAGDTSRSVSADGRTFLSAAEGDRASALGISRPWVTKDGVTMVSSGFAGVSDGLTDLLGGAADARMDWVYDVASEGNVEQLGWIDVDEGDAERVSFDVVLGFGESEAAALATTRAALSSDVGAAQRRYDAGWRQYARSLDTQGGTADDQYYLAAMALKTIQDKSNGAMIAAMATPWGETQGDENTGGYHLVWARDLFKFANALLTAGDLPTARRAVEYLFRVQQQKSDCGVSENDAAGCPQGFSRVGRFPQNTRVDGEPYWTSTQLDEQAMPILLASRLYELGGRATRRELTALWPEIRATADYILELGPWTQQERWEESAGYSPSTIAAEIAGLVAASEFARRGGDLGRAGRYLAAADYWQQHVTAWTFTTTGPHGDGRYYIRLNPSLRSNDGSGLERFEPEAGPDAPLSFTINNGGGTHDQREVVDGGFLELVRLGVKAPDDGSIVDSLPEYDSVIGRSIAGKGDAWFRYNFDGYGETNDGRSWDNMTGRGRLWPIFTAERGLYEIGKSGSGGSGSPYLAMLKAFSTPEGFLSEQIWNETTSVTGWQVTTPPPYLPGTPTKSVCPLSWAMGEYINLLASIRAGTIVDMPALVCGRYGNCVVPPAAGEVALVLEARASTSPDEQLYVTGSSEELGRWDPDLGVPAKAGSDYATWTVRVNLPARAPLEYRYYKKTREGGVVWETLEGGDNRGLRMPARGALAQADSVVW
jgi:glucoamylase